MTIYGITTIAGGSRFVGTIYAACAADALSFAKLLHDGVTGVERTDAYTLAEVTANVGDLLTCMEARTLRAQKEGM